MPLEIVSHSPEETQGLGRWLGKRAGQGEVVLLVGGLGAGKTCLVQGMAWGLGVPGYIMSPSFVILRVYQGRLPLYHLDFYRLEGREVLDLGLEEYLAGRGVTVIEWAERAREVWPPEYLLISLEILSETERALRFQPQGKAYREKIEGLRRWSWP